MALNLDAVGRKIAPFTRSYDWKDLALYAVGVVDFYKDQSFMEVTDQFWFLPKQRPRFPTKTDELCRECPV